MKKAVNVTEIRSEIQRMKHLLFTWAWGETSGRGKWAVTSFVYRYNLFNHALNSLNAGVYIYSCVYLAVPLWEIRLTFGTCGVSVAY